MVQNWRNLRSQQKKKRIDFFGLHDLLNEEKINMFIIQYTVSLFWIDKQYSDTIK